VHVISSFTGILYKVVILIMACNGHIFHVPLIGCTRNNNNLKGGFFKKDMGFFKAYAAVKLLNNSGLQCIYGKEKCDKTKKNQYMYQFFLNIIGGNTYLP
jgi:hypothetical protein